MLNIDGRPIANKYCEGKMKRTLKRELKVPEIAGMEADCISSFAGGLLEKVDLVCRPQGYVLV